MPCRTPPSPRDECADPGRRGAGPVRGDYPAARRAPGAHPYRRSGPLPAVLAVPDSSWPRSPCRPVSRCSGPSRDAAFRGFGSGVVVHSIPDACRDGPRHGGGRPAGGGALDPGQGRGLRRADGLHPGRCVPARADDQPVPRVRRVLLVTFPMLLGGSPLWSLAIAGIAALILLNSMDAESLRARQAEQQRCWRSRRSSGRQRPSSASVDGPWRRSRAPLRCPGLGWRVTWSELAPPQLRVRTVEIDDPGPLLALLPPEDAYAWVRRGEGLVAFGEAVPGTSPPALRRRTSGSPTWWPGTEVVSELTAGRRAPGCVAFGSFVFDPERSAGQSTLVVPQTVIGRRRPELADPGRPRLGGLGGVPPGVATASSTGPVPAMARPPEPPRGLRSCRARLTRSPGQPQLPRPYAGSSPAGWTRWCWRGR